MQGNDDDDNDNNNASSISLPTFLKTLFGLAGATLSLPSLAMTCLINDQIAIPIMYLPAYYAVAFLPYSLKPMYSLATNWLEYVLHFPRYITLSLLLFGSGVTIFSLGLLSKGSVVKAFILAFTNGLFSSWSDLLMSFVLLEQHPTLTKSSHPSRRHAAEEEEVDDDQVHLLTPKEYVLEPDDHGSGSPERPVDASSPIKSANVSFMQIQAATCRNIGSYIASLITFGVFFYQYMIWKADHGTFSEDGNLRMNHKSVMIFLAMTASLPWCSILIVQYNKSHFINNSKANVTHDSNGGCIEHGSYNYIINALSLMSFQFMLVLASLRSLIITHVSTLFWNTLFGVFIFVFILTLSPTFGLGSCIRANETVENEPKDASSNNEALEYTHRRKMKRVCIYILLRNAIPTPNILLGSFTYSTFSQSPLLLQSFYIIQLLVTTLASYVYQKYIAKYYYSGEKLKSIIVYVTILNSSCILCFMGLFWIYPDLYMISSLTLPMLLFFLVTLLSSFVEELAFLPNVIIASITAAHGNSKEGESILASKDQVYAFLVSCIDFGDQISAWITVPLIEALAINRENGWNHIDKFLGLCAILGLLSLCFLPLLR